MTMAVFALLPSVNGENRPAILPVHWIVIILRWLSESKFVVGCANSRAFREAVMGGCTRRIRRPSDHQNRSRLPSISASIVPFGCSDQWSCLTNYGFMDLTLSFNIRFQSVVSINGLTSSWADLSSLCDYFFSRTLELWVYCNANYSITFLTLSFPRVIISSAASSEISQHTVWRTCDFS